MSTIGARHAGCSGSGCRGNRSPTSCTTGCTPPAPRAGFGRHGRRRRPRRARLPGHGAGEAGVRRGHPGTLQGQLAIGHTRHSSPGGSCWQNAQPVFKTDAAGSAIALAHNGNLTNTAALAGHLIPQESPAGWPVQPRASSDTDVIAELLARGADLSLEEAIVATVPRLRALTEAAAPAGIGPARGLCTACFTASYPIPMPDTAVANLRASVATQPTTVPLPNP